MLRVDSKLTHFSTHAHTRTRAHTHTRTHTHHVATDEANPEVGSGTTDSALGGIHVWLGAVPAGISTEDALHHRYARTTWCSHPPMGYIGHQIGVV